MEGFDLAVVGAGPGGCPAAIRGPMGFARWVADAETDQLPGAQAVGPHATELIAEAATAIRAELTATEDAQIIQAYPTFADAWMEAAHVLRGEPLHVIPKRKI